MSSFQGPQGMLTHRLTHFVRKCIPGLLTQGSIKSTRLSTELTWRDSGCPLDWVAIASSDCGAVLPQPGWLKYLRGQIHACSVLAPPPFSYFVVSWLAIQQEQLSKAVFLRNNTAVKIPHFTLASRHIFSIVFDTHISTTCLKESVSWSPL